MCRIVWYYIYTYYIWASVEMGIIHSQNGWYFLEAWIVLQVSHLLKCQKEDCEGYQGRWNIYVWCPVKANENYLKNNLSPRVCCCWAISRGLVSVHVNVYLNKPYWRSIVEKNLLCTLIGLLKLVIFNRYMNWKCQKSIQNAELLPPVAQNWHIFFRCYEEMAENRRKQQKSMSLSLTSETAVEYTIWPTNDTYIITVCWVMKNREKQMISTS